MPVGAFYIFPDIRSTGLTSREFSLGLLQQKNVACVPGPAFGASGEGYVRCCYATSLEQIKEAMSRVADFVDAVRAQRPAAALAQT
jgi:aminotransferase